MKLSNDIGLFVKSFLKKRETNIIGIKGINIRATIIFLKNVRTIPFILLGFFDAILVP